MAYHVKHSRWLTLALLPWVILGASSPVKAEIRLIEAQGEVYIQQRIFGLFPGPSRPVSPIRTLSLGDTLRVLQGSVVISCENSLTRHRLPQGTSSISNYCSPNISPTTAGGLRGDDSAPGRLSVIPGGVNSNYPYVIRPRRTWLLDDQPQIVWNPIPGARQYTVRVEGPDVSWSQTVETNQVIYPGEPALTPGETYLVTVEADAGQSSLDESTTGLWEQLGDDAAFLYETNDGTGLGFSLLPPTITPPVIRELEQLDEQGLSQDAKAVSQADILIRNDLFADAIAILEARATAGSEVATVYQLLGELYAHTGLNQLARDRLLQAISRAVDAHDQENLIVAQVELANVYAIMNNRPMAETWLSLASHGYGEMEASQLKIEIAEKIGDAHRAIGNTQNEQVWLRRALDGYRTIYTALQQVGETDENNPQIQQIAERVDILTIRLSQF